MHNVCARQRQIPRSTLRQHWPTEGASNMHRTWFLKAYEQIRWILPFIRKLGPYRWVVNITFQPLYPRGRTPASTRQEAGCASKAVWMFARRKKSLASTGIQIRDRPAHCKVWSNLESPCSSNPVVPFVFRQDYGNGQAVCYASYCQPCNDWLGQYNQLLNKINYCLRKLGLI